MQLGLHHEYLLCVLHDTRGTRLIDSTLEGFGLAGALVGELQLTGRLVAAEANVFRLRAGEMPSGALGIAAARLDGFGGSLKRCIYRVHTRHLFASAGALRVAALDELVDAGVLSRVDDTLLTIPWRKRYPQIAASVERALRERLRGHIAATGAGDAPSPDDLLLSLLRASGLLDTVWTDDELRVLRPAIDRRTERAPLGRTVWQCVVEQQAAIAAT